MRYENFSSHCRDQQLHFLLWKHLVFYIFSYSWWNFLYILSLSLHTHISFFWGGKKKNSWVLNSPFCTFAYSLKIHFKGGPMWAITFIFTAAQLYIINIAYIKQFLIDRRLNYFLTFHFNTIFHFHFTHVITTKGHIPITGIGISKNECIYKLQMLSNFPLYILYQFLLYSHEIFMRLPFFLTWP